MLFSTEWWKQVYFRILEKINYITEPFLVRRCHVVISNLQGGKFVENTKWTAWHVAESKTLIGWRQAHCSSYCKLHIRKEVNIKTSSKRKLSLHKESNTSWNQLEIFSWRKLYNKFRLIMCFYLICFNMSCTYMMGVNNWQDKRKSTQTEPL